MATEQIPTGLIADDAVTTAKVADDAITGALIENNPTIAGNLTVSGTTTTTGAFTASGGIANAGTISAGTLGANVAFNNAHKDIRKEDYILLGFAVTTDYNGMADITSTSSNLWEEVYKGSGITHPYHPTSTNLYGRFKVSKAGLYLVWWSMHNASWTNDTNEVIIVRNGGYITGSHSDSAGSYGGRGYISDAAETRYVTSGTKIVILPLNADDNLNLYGQGNYYGTTQNPMGQFGAIRLGDRV